MSFIKVKDPRKREELTRDFIETRKRIKDNFVARKVGESEYQTGLTKLFKPVTETQKATAKEITEAQKATAEKFTTELLPIKEGISGLTTAIKQLPITPIETEEEAITFPSYPNVRMTEEEKTNLGLIAQQYLSSPYNEEKIDTIFGLNNKNPEKKIKIGDKLVTFVGDDIKVDGHIYKGTHGLWNLIINKNPDPEEYTADDLEQYKDLLIRTNTIFLNNDPEENSPKKFDYKGVKWKNIIRDIWYGIKPFKKGKGGKGGKGGKEDPKPGTSGTGLKILPSDPNALIDRFDLLFSSKKAGHTGVRNEIVSILDELKRQGVLKTNEYKKLNSLIKK